jgi:hypothetical protein
VMEMCTGMAESVAWVSVNLPAVLSRPAFQVRMRFATASTSCCSTARCSLTTDSGAPK